MVSISNSTVGFVAGPNSTVNITGDVNVNSHHSQLAVPRPSRHFHGRDDDMARLHELFFQEGKRKVVISGLAGYGKTELAKHFAERFASRHVHQVFWVPAETCENLKTTYNSILKKSFKTDSTSLYVYDNAVTRHDISEYLPPDMKNALVLITSQVHDWGDDIVSLDLKPVRVRASLDIFREILADRYERVKNEITSREIIKFTDGIPLALVLIAGFLRRTMDVLGSDFDILKFKNDILSTGTLDKKIDRAVDSPYRHSIRTAIHVTLNNMSTYLDPEENNITHIVLCVFAFLNPDRIKIKEVEEILNMCGVHDKGLIRQCVHTITDFSFIQSENGCHLFIHRLCQQLFVNYYDDEKKKIKEACYRACVLWMLEQGWAVHRFAILRQADNNKAVVNEILREYCLCDEGDNVVLQPHQPNYWKFVILLECLVEYGCKDCLLLFFNGINASSRQHIRNELGLLVSAAQTTEEGAADVVRLLLDLAGDVRARDCEMRTPLHMAAWIRNEAVTCALLNAGSDVQAKDSDGQTALHVAAGRGCKDVVSALLAAGCDVLATDSDGQTALHVAAGSGWEAGVSTLLAAGSDIHISDWNGQTALHKAARCERPWWVLGGGDYEEVVQMLLFRGADVNAWDSRGRTALDMASTEGWFVSEVERRHVQQILRAHGAIDQQQW